MAGWPIRSDATGFYCIFRSLAVPSLMAMHALMYFFTATVPFERLPPRPTLNHPPRIYTPTCPAFVIANHRSEHIVCDAPSEPHARGRDHHRLDSLCSAARRASPPRHASILKPRRVTVLPVLAQLMLFVRGFQLVLFC